jgi:hypothetical protein
VHHNEKMICLEVFIPTFILTQYGEHSQSKRNFILDGMFWQPGKTPSQEVKSL